MITPSFTVTQDDATVTITIHTPYVRAQDVDIHVQGSEFRFYLKPYFLRLHLPGNIVENDDSKASYDPSSGQFTITVSKETKGQHFPDLDLLTKLLARRGEAAGGQQEPKKPLIEVIGSEDHDNDQDEIPLSDEMKEAIDFNWELPQELPNQNFLLANSTYGFNNQYSGYFTHIHETLNEINVLSEPEKSTPESRRRERCEGEDIKFDEDYYAMDFINNEEIQNVIKYKTIWYKELKRIQKNAKKEAEKGPLIQEVDQDVVSGLNMDSLNITDSKESLIKFTSKQEEMMRNLPNKEFLLSNEKSTYLGLVDIMFAYCYNERIFEGENSVESVWCIGSLSSSIAALEQFTTLKEVLVSNFRRALAFPLYRNFELCTKVLQDVYVMFRLGKRAILKALLSVKDVFDHHDVYYIYSKIWIDDYCVWIQHASDAVLRTLAHELHHFSVSKADIGWDLEELEEVAKQMQELETMEQT